MGFPRFFPRFGYKLTHSEWFTKVAKQSFESVDVDADGALDVKELYIALLKLYDTLNDYLPCHITIPDMAQVNKLMEQYDADKSGKLRFEEYLPLTRSLVGTRKNWRQSLLLKVTLAVLFKTVAMPLGGRLLRHGLLSACGRVGWRHPVVEKCVPLGVTMLGFEYAVKPVYRM